MTGNAAQEQEEFAKLQAAETSLMDYGRRLYGRLGWRTFNCARVDTNGRSNSPMISCGDRRFGRPVCPLPQPTRIPSNNPNNPNVKNKNEERLPR